MLNGNDALVDQIKAIAGGTATIFMGDTRIATNVMKPDGSGRAVGTKLAKNAANESVLGKGKPFRGQVPILGEIYFTGLTRSRTRTARPSASSMSAEEVRVLRGRRSHAVGAGIAAATLLVVLGSPSFFSTRWLLGPLGRIRGAGRPRRRPRRHRGALPRAPDEIGAMAKSVQVFKDSMIETGRLRAEQGQLKAQSDAERRQSMLALAQRFEATVGGIVGEVGSSATELQKTARAMADNAEEAPRASRPRSPRPPTTPPAACRPWPRRPRNCLPRSARSASQVTGIDPHRRHRGRARPIRPPTQVQGLLDAAQKIGDVVRPHQRHRQPDQPAGAQRHDRGGARR